MQHLVTLFLAIFVVVIQLHGQQLCTIHYTVDEGLPANELYDVYEDRDGYLWLASDQGLIRFDGAVFDNYTSPLSLVSNTVFSVQPDRNGILWIRGIDGTLCAYQDGVFRPFPYNDQLRDCLGARFIEDFYWAKDGQLYFSSSGHFQDLFVWDGKTGVASPLSLPPGHNLALLVEAGRPVFAHYRDSGATAVGGSALPANFMTARVSLDNKVASAVSMLTLPDGSVVIGIASAVLHWKNGRLVTQLGPFAGRKGLSIDQHGDVLISSMDGVWKWTPGSQAPTLFLSAQHCSQSIQDRNGNYWIATLGGLTMVPYLLARAKDTTLTPNFGVPKCLASTPQGLVCLARDPARLYLLLSGGSGAPSDDWMPLFHSFGAFIHDFAMGQGGNVVYGLGAFRHYGRTIPPTTMELAAEPDINGIYDVTVAGGTILYGTKSGWMMLDSASGTIYDSRAHGFKEWCTAIERDAAGRVWIGTRDQLMYFDGRHTRVYRPGDHLFHTRVTHIKAGPDGILAISTRGNGVILIQEGRIWQLDQRLGLPSNHCGNLSWGKRGLWIATNQGLALLHRDKLRGWPQIQVITTMMGLSSKMIYDVCEHDGKVFVATAKGINWFQMEAVEAQLIVPGVKIHRAKVGERAMAAGARLHWNDRQVSFEFSAARLLGAPSAKYRYRLHGYDPIWRTTDARTVSYFELPPGDYRFEVGGSRSDGRWDQRTTFFHFSVAAHFTQTLWFRAVVVASGVVALLLLMTYQMQLRRRRQAKEWQLQRAEYKVLRAQMKPHFMYNALNAIQHYILKGDRQSSARYLSQFAALTRLVMAQSDRSAVTVAEEIETLRLYIDLEQMRFDQDFVYDIVAFEDAVLNLDIPPMVIQPFVENAILHGLLYQPDQPALLVTVAATATGHEWQVTDNGPGRAAAAARGGKPPGHVSTALRNIEERIGLMNALGVFQITLHTEDVHPSGTRVRIHIATAHQPFRK